MAELIDTHAHIHFSDYGLDPDDVLSDAKKVGVNKVLVVGCDLPTSRLGIEFADKRDGVWASVGVHPHTAEAFLKTPGSFEALTELVGSTSKKLVAIGECGLDYYYENSPKEHQRKLLEMHLELALEHNLPVIFHVRDAYEDFWPIYDNFSGLRGVLHSFSATPKDLDEALKRGLYIGLNGIMTFTKDEEQLEAAKLVPKDRLVLETDAPYLTPKPFRGKICKPEYVKITAEFLADLRSEQLNDLAEYTTHNASQLFRLL